jgi:hypothetical protein
MKRDRLLAGDRIVVRSPEEILSTLDADGTLDGLPFMPEMLDWCGKPFRIQRRAEKTCVEVRPDYSNRRFAGNGVVLLDGPRCDGNAHDGCQRGCRFFWKENWLRPAQGDEPMAPVSEAGLAELRARLKVKAGDDRYFCQSTELAKATEAFPGRKKPWMLRIAFREIRNGDRSLPEMAKLFTRWSWQMLRNAASGRAHLRGPLKQTPIVLLGLQAGEVVRVKSRDEIVQTLGQNGRNRGMSITNEMTRCCGKEAEVRVRVNRIIEEKSGRMRLLQNTVMLRNVRGDPTVCEECLCSDEVGDCPRGELMYWREIWLERVTDARP